MTDFLQTPDSDLVQQALAGDMSALAAIYDRYADRLNTYCFAMLRDRDDAADAVQDTFVKAANKLGQLRDADRLRPWLFSIARNEAHARGRQRARVSPTEDLSEMLVEDPDMTRSIRQDELKELVWAAADGLSERDRELLTLNLVEGLEGAELASALGVSISHVHVLVSRMKDRVERSIGALLIARLGNEDCPQLQTILERWDGTFSLDTRSQVTRHVESCESCTSRRAVLLAPANVLPGVMLVPAPAGLRKTVLRDIEISLGLAPKRAGWKTAVTLSGAAAVVVVAGWFGVSALSSSNGPVAGPVPTTATLGGTSTTFIVSGDTPLTTVAPLVAPVPPTPASLAVSKNTVVFDDGVVSLTVELRNEGDAPTDWQSRVDVGGVSVSPSGGVLDGGASVTVEIALDRTELVEGLTEGHLVLTSPESSLQVALEAMFFDDPALQAPVLADNEIFVLGGACVPLQTTISVVRTDRSPLAKVSARWSPDGRSSVETELTPSGANTYAGTIGPYSFIGSTDIQVTAVDTFGNAGGASTTLTVTRCSGP